MTPRGADRQGRWRLHQACGKDDVRYEQDTLPSARWMQRQTHPRATWEFNSHMQKAHRFTAVPIRPLKARNLLAPCQCRCSPLDMHMRRIGRGQESLRASVYGANIVLIKTPSSTKWVMYLLSLLRTRVAYRNLYLQQVGSTADGAPTRLLPGAIDVTRWRCL